MSPSNPLLQTLATMPVAPGVKAHSIIAIDGDDEPPKGDDGVVEYKSAHQEGVESEYIVRSGHSCQGHPLTIEEVRRILLEHLKSISPVPSAAATSAVTPDNPGLRAKAIKWGDMRFLKVLLLIVFLILAVWVQAEQKNAPDLTEEETYGMNLFKGYAGSRSCIECHEKFYKLWSTSFHGLSMQPYTAAFAKAKLTPQAHEITIGKYRYRADISGGTGWVIEKGPDGEKKYPMEQAIGGKYVYYFLTTLERGKLQTLPLAYDVHKKEWFDTAASGIRHFPDAQRTDSPVFWKDQAYTFNTACFGCHVSQMRTNYDLKTDTYKTVWKEPGINCETCHGPSEEHNRVCEQAGQGNVPADLKIISAKKFTVAQHNDSCGSCHAKAVVLTNNFTPGERFFDHFDLATLEDPDFYPDGRDLGENYTHTTWLMSPCVQSGKLSCIHCHTSSGRYRFKAEDKANNACLPCHKERVENAAAHTNHPPGTPASTVHRLPHAQDGIRPDEAQRPLPASPDACRNACL